MHGGIQHTGVDAELNSVNSNQFKLIPSVSCFITFLLLSLLPVEGFSQLKMLRCCVRVALSNQRCLKAHMQHSHTHEIGFCLKRISQSLLHGNSIASLPSVCHCLTFVDSRPDSWQQAQAGSEWKQSEMKPGCLRRCCMRQFLFQTPKETKDGGSRGVIWWLAFFSPHQECF